MYHIRLCVILFLFPALAYCQSDTTQVEPSKWELSGYIKDLQIATFGKALDELQSDNFIHNRLNLRYFHNDKVTAGIDLRTRLFTGSAVKNIPNYGNLLAFDNGFVDLSAALIDNSTLALVSQIDRLWVDYSTDDWEVRIGRQRINWGMNLFWNSNDLFNAYSLIDFDYEERAGADALRVQRHFKDFSTLELAVKPGNNSREWIAALRYGFFKWEYDFQVIASKWNQDIALGVGWAGNIGNVGFKGESTYFFVPENNASKSGISSSISFDYIFPNTFFLTTGFHYNSNGATSSAQNQFGIFATDVSAKNLTGSKYNIILSLNSPISPLIGTGLSTVYSPGVQSLLFLPSVNYSIATNWEIAFFAQTFFLKVENFDNLVNGLFLRIKGSF